MWLRGISGHGASRTVFQWGSNIQSPWLCAITSRCRCWLVGYWSFTPLQHLRTGTTSWQCAVMLIYNDAPLGNQSQYLDTELANPCPLFMPITKPGSSRYNFYKSLVWLNQEENSDLPLTRPAHYRFCHRRAALCRSLYNWDIEPQYKDT